MSVKADDAKWAIVSSWSGASHGGAYLAVARSIEHSADLIAEARRRCLPLSFRGGGCSYSDSILNRDGFIIDTTGLNRILDWNPQTGRLRVQGGVTMAAVLRHTLRENWVLASVPGSLNVTVGGAIANNVHGKDAARYGNFGNQVVRFTLLNGRAELVEVDQERTPDLFYVRRSGGFGLFGLIVEAELQLVPVPSPRVLVESRTSRSMAETITDLEDSRTWDYGQVWVDGFARGAGLGRGVTKLARYTDGGDAQPDADIERWLEVKTNIFGVVPTKYLWRAGRPMFLPPRMRYVNWAYYQKARLEARLARQKVQSFGSFYFFHNNIRDFYSVYRPPGFLTIQALLPKVSAADTLPELLRLAQRVAAAPVLCGMKRHRPDDFVLSFQGDGYSISLELPLQGRDRAQLEAAMHRVFAYITGVGGRINLSKDETVPREMFQTMYPRHAAFWTLKKAQDPDGVFMCDLARRLLA